MKAIAVIFTVLAITSAFPTFLPKEANSCKSDLEDAVTQGMSIYQEFKNGKIDFLTVLNQVTDLANDVNAMATTDCSPESFYDAVVSEYTQLVHVSSPANCQTELTKAWPQVATVVDDVKTKNWSKLAMDGIQLVETAQGAVHDCAPSQGFFVGNDTDQCFQDTEDVFKNVYNIYQMFSTGDINPIALVTMVETIVTDAQRMIGECGNAQDIVDAAIDEYVKLFNPVNATDCRNDLNNEWV